MINDGQFFIDHTV